MPHPAATLSEFRLLAADSGLPLIPSSEHVHPDGALTVDTEESAIEVMLAMRANGHRISAGRAWKVWRVLILP